jgi:hypothetical protein
VTGRRVTDGRARRVAITVCRSWGAERASGEVHGLPGGIVDNRKFKDESAQLLNATFGVDALKGGLEVGVAKITVNTGS